jgi:hypothetical protein
MLPCAQGRTAAKEILLPETLRCINIREVEPFTEEISKFLEKCNLIKRRGGTNIVGSKISYSSFGMLVGQDSGKHWTKFKKSVHN